MILHNTSSTELYRKVDELKRELASIRTELFLRGEISPDEFRKEAGLKTLTVLTAPGAINDETVELIRKQYKESGALVLTDGLYLRIGEVVDGVQIFYLLAPTFISKKVAKELKKYAKANLKNFGYDNFKVIVLGDGIKPVTLEL